MPSFPLVRVVSNSTNELKTRAPGRFGLRLCSAESRSSVDCAVRLTRAAGLVPSESLAP